MGLRDYMAFRRARNPGPFTVLDDPTHPVTRQWAEDQNRLAAGYERLFEPVTSAFHQAILATQPTGRIGAPVTNQAGTRQFHVKQPADSDFRQVVVVADGREHVVLDDAWFTGGKDDGYPRVSPYLLKPSPDGRYVAVLIDQDGTQFHQLLVMDVDAVIARDNGDGDERHPVAELLPGPYVNPQSDVLWVGNNQFLHCMARDNTSPSQFRGAHVYRHTVGKSTDQDTRVWANPRTVGFLALGKLGEHHVTVTSKLQLGTQSEVWEARLGSGGTLTPFRRLFTLNGSRNAAVDVGPDNQLYMITDRETLRPNGANTPWGELVRTPLDRDAPPQSWEPLIPEQEGVVLRDFTLLTDPQDSSTIQRIVVRQARHGQDELAVYDMNVTGKPVNPRIVGFPGPGNIHHWWKVGTDGRCVDIEWSGTNRRPLVYRLDPATAQLTPQQETALGVMEPAQSADPGLVDHIASMWMHIPAPAGHHIHADVSIPADATGAVPMLVMGYGFYDEAPPEASGLGYQAQLDAWVRMGGGVIRLAARGGDERGRDDYERVRAHNQQLTLDDFHAAAAWAISNGLASEVGVMGLSGGAQRAAQVMWNSKRARDFNPRTGKPLYTAFSIDRAPLDLNTTSDDPGLGAIWVHSVGDPSDPRQWRRLEQISPYHQAERHRRRARISAMGRKLTGALRGPADQPELPAARYDIAARDRQVDPSARRTAQTHQAASGRSDTHIRVEQNGHPGPTARTTAARQEASRLAWMAERLGLMVDVPWPTRAPVAQTPEALQETLAEVRKEYAKTPEAARHQSLPPVAEQPPTGARPSHGQPRPDVPGAGFVPADRPRRPTRHLLRFPHPDPGRRPSINRPPKGHGR